MNRGPGSAPDPTRRGSGGSDGPGGRPSAGLERLGELLSDAYPGGPPPSAAAGTGNEPAPRSAVSDGVHAAPADIARRVAAVWPDVVGDEAAANSRPLRLRAGRLSASASSSAWAQTLQFLADAIAVRLNERLGSEAVKEVVFHHAGWEEGPPAATAKSRRKLAPGEPFACETAVAAEAGGAGWIGAPAADPREPALGGAAPDTPERASALTPEQERALADVEAMDLEPELKTRIVHAMRVAFVRGQRESVR